MKLRMLISLLWLAPCLIAAGENATPEEAARIRAISSEPEGLTVVGDYVFFSARDPKHGRELWVVDASTNLSPVLVADIVEGPRDSDPKFIFDRNNFVYLSAETPKEGRELWACDYLPSHTWGISRLADLQPGSFGSNPVPIANFRGFTILSAATLDEGRELYIAQGTETPRLLADLYPGNKGFASAPINVAVAGTRFFMTGYVPGDFGVALMVTEGTADSTRIVCDVDDEAGNMTPLNATHVVFENHTNQNGWEPWISDGTPEGTHILKDIAPGSADCSPKNFVQWGERILFEANLPETGKELWITDGTEAGTTLVKDIAPGQASSDPFYFKPCGNLVFFSAETKEYGRELWMTDGTESGTRMVVDAFSGAHGTGPYALAAGTDRLVFSIDDGTHGEESWVVMADGSNAHLLKDIFPGPKNAQPAHTVCVQRRGRFYFSAEEPTHGRELWRYDVATEEVTLTDDISSESEPDASSSPAQLTPCGTYLYFTANNLINGTELWRCGTRLDDVELVKDIFEGPPSASPHDLLAVPPYLYFSADDGVHGDELWRTDGTAVGTVMVGEVVVGEKGGAPRNLCVWKNQLWFSATTPEFGEELYKHTIGELGIERVSDIAMGPPSAAPHALHIFQDRLYFVANDGEHGDELWVVPWGKIPELVRNIAPSPVDRLPMNEVVAGPGGIYGATPSPATGAALVHVNDAGAQSLPSVGAEAR